MKASLYDVLRGTFGDGRRIASVSPDAWREKSILSNLDRLMNTRRGALSHLPDFGLPDLSDVYRDMPGSIGELQRSVEAAVEVFEPRLRRVRVEHQATDRYAMQLVFLLTAETLEGERVRFKTTFSSEEEAHVSPVVAAQ
ncbi:MAG: type VI secretion system baseplate subunit TssE [Rhodothermales bacterium]